MVRVIAGDRSPGIVAGLCFFERSVVAGPFCGPGPADASVAALELVLEGEGCFGNTGFYSAVPTRDVAGVRLPDIGAE